MKEVHHFRHVVLWWLVTSAIATPIVVLVLAPGMPPGNGTVESSGQVVDNTVLLGVATPITAAVLVFFAYSLIAFREGAPHAAPVDGPALRGHAGVQLWWIVITTGVVIFLAAYGTIRLLQNGAGGGQGPNPISVPDPPGGAKPLQVQVIAQQWEFTYRFPSYGGIETNDIDLPTNTLVEFHVTSLDVIHSFWAIQLGVKADANPGIDNIAYVTTKGPLHFMVRCAELCGVWHGYMFNSGQVVPKPQFATWIAQQQRRFAAAHKVLPPYSRTYFPAPLRRGG